jgi:hypothetical protein
MMKLMIGVGVAMLLVVLFTSGVVLVVVQLGIGY